MLYDSYDVCGNDFSLISSGILDRHTINREEVQTSFRNHDFTR